MLDFDSFHYLKKKWKIKFIIYKHQFINIVYRLIIYLKKTKMNTGTEKDILGCIFT